MSTVQQTFVIIKPDAIERGLIGKIISRFEDKFYRIVAIQMRWKNEEWCKAHYSHLSGDIYEKMRDFMTAAPIIGIILFGPNVIDVIRHMVGCTDSRYATLGTIRGDYGTHPKHYNIVHASDSEEAVDKEIKLFFDSKTDNKNE